MSWRPLTFVVLAVVGATACSRSRLPDLDDLGQLQGAWRIESSVWNGVPEPDAARSVTILFEGDKFVVVDRDGNRREETIRLMPDRSPKAIDRQDGSGPASPGIYTLEGDRFTWCSAGAGNTTRPAAFASTPGSRQSLIVLRRVKG
jgi:uncharacterized protein (TIGR03067 family)